MSVVETQTRRGHVGLSVKCNLLCKLYKPAITEEGLVNIYIFIYIVHINAKFSSCKFCLILYYCCKSFLAELICSLFYPTKIMVKWILHSTNILLKIVWNTHLSPFDMHISCIKRRISIQNVIPELRGPFFFNGLTNMGLHRKRPTA